MVTLPQKKHGIGKVWALLVNSFLTSNCLFNHVNFSLFWLLKTKKMQKYVHKCKKKNYKNLYFNRRD